jgi:uncharacterized metal-binding protein YceD (DUF177 family)
MTTTDGFSRPVKVDAVPREGLLRTVEATPAERAALAGQNDLVEIAELKARFVLKRAGKGVSVSGALHAEVTQTCVVTLEPFPVTLDEEIDVRFAPPAEERAGGAETLALDGEDPPDPLLGGKVDLGALAAEFLALALDPYPRKPGAEFTPPHETAPPESPFVALAEIAKRKG